MFRIPIAVNCIGVVVALCSFATMNLVGVMCGVGTILLSTVLLLVEDWYYGYGEIKERS